MEPLRLALVGCGLMGARHLRGYGELERVRPGTLDLVAVCDFDQARANAVADEAAELLGDRPRVVSDVTALREVEAADVVTPNRTHDTTVVALLEAGLHVQVEKPFAVTIARGRRMLEAAARTGRLLAVAENNRRDPVNRLLKHVVESGLIGELTFLQMVTINRGGRVIGTPWRHKLSMGGLPMDVWIHLAYEIEHAAGPIDSVFAVGGVVDLGRSWKLADGTTELVACETPDVLAATLKFENGATGSWTTHFASRGEGRSDRLLLGREGTVRAPTSRSGGAVMVQRGSEVLEGDALVAALPDWRLPELEAALFGERPGSYQLEGPVTDRKLIAAEVNDFADAVRGGGTPESPGEVGLRSVAIILALLESLQAGRPVRLAEVLSGAVHAYQDRIEAAT